MLFFHRQNSSAFAGNEFHRKGYNGIDAFSFIRAGVSVDMKNETMHLDEHSLNKYKAENLKAHLFARTSNKCRSNY